MLRGGSGRRAVLRRYKHVVGIVAEGGRQKQGRRINQADIPQTALTQVFILAFS